MHIEATVDLPISASLFWTIRNREDYLAIECKYLKNASKVCTSEDRDTDGRVTAQHLATKPDLSIVPPFLLKMLPGDDGLVFYDDLEFCFDDETTPYAFIARTTPSVFNEKAKIKGYVRVIPSADGLSCTQSVSMDAKVSQWGVGGIVETLVAKGIQDAYHIMPDMVREWQKTQAQIETETPETSPQPAAKRAKSEVRMRIPKPATLTERRKATSIVLDDIGLHYSTDLLHFAKPVLDAVPSSRPVSPSPSNTLVEGDELKDTHFPRHKNIPSDFLSSSTIMSERNVVPSMHKLDDAEQGYLGNYSFIFQSTTLVPVNDMTDGDNSAVRSTEVQRVHSGRSTITGPLIVICRIYILYYLFSIGQMLGIGN
ncbi:hypothetical protein SARC_01631 [Sphaeroforma arctica JP610]|uniref:Uncharacterized protein n=1 Tax=Sphaeroforma arctica JP610 TaxID=667725 RepID=A0A0L0GBE9_9EUKA|nr:hypothetical protein SARC_01631 [Sphaeroforma arctica JP610]KNC86221.1 hypothetical protein SARC_01631 [Sphaeroforma arctica JP610]|eukprot:XP_014160123.1 hypothetical protein SARC_01631 [Sphaeroforma arctica JP610]